METDQQIIVAWLHQRWVWHTTTLKAVSRVMFYEDLEVGGSFYKLRAPNALIVVKNRICQVQLTAHGELLAVLRP